MKTKISNNKTKAAPHFWQPDGDNFPKELNSFDVFTSQEDCKLWLKENDYDENTKIVGYGPADIIGVTVMERNPDENVSPEDRWFRQPATYLRVKIHEDKDIVVKTLLVIIDDYLWTCLMKEDGEEVYDFLKSEEVIDCDFCKFEVESIREDAFERECKKYQVVNLLINCPLY